MSLEHVFFMGLWEKLGLIKWFPKTYPHVYPERITPSQRLDFPTSTKDFSGALLFDSNKWIEEQHIHILSNSYESTASSLETKERYLLKSCVLFPVGDAVFQPICPVVQHQPRLDIHQFPSPLQPISTFSTIVSALLAAWPVALLVLVFCSWLAFGVWFDFLRPRNNTEKPEDCAPIDKTSENTTLNELTSARDVIKSVNKSLEPFQADGETIAETAASMVDQLHSQYQTTLVLRLMMKARDRAAHRAIRAWKLVAAFHKQKNDSLAEDNSKLKERNQTLTKEKQAIEIANEELTKRNNELEAENIKLQKKFEVKCQSINNNNARTEKAEENLKAKETELEEVVKAKTEVEAHLERMDEDLKSARAKLAAKEAELDQAVKTNADGVKAKAEVEANLERVNEDVKFARADLATKQNELNDVMETNDKVVGDLEKQVRSLKQQKIDTDKTIKDLGVEVGILQQNNKHLEESKQSLIRNKGQDIDSIKDTVKAKDRTIASLRSEVRDLKNDVENLTESGRKADRQCKDAKQALQNEINDLKSESKVNAHGSEAASDLERQLKDAEAQIEAKDQEHQAKEEAETQLKAQLEAKEQELKTKHEVEAKLREAEAALKARADELKAKEELYSQLATQSNLIVEQNKAAEQQQSLLREKEAELAEQTKKAEDLAKALSEEKNKKLEGQNATRPPLPASVGPFRSSDSSSAASSARAPFPAPPEAERWNAVGFVRRGNDEAPLNAPTGPKTNRLAKEARLKAEKDEQAKRLNRVSTSGPSSASGTAPVSPTIKLPFTPAGGLFSGAGCPTSLQGAFAALNGPVAADDAPAQPSTPTQTAPPAEQTSPGVPSPAPFSPPASQPKVKTPAVGPDESRYTPSPTVAEVPAATPPRTTTRQSISLDGTPASPESMDRAPLPGSPGPAWTTQSDPGASPPPLFSKSATTVPTEVATPIVVAAEATPASTPLETPGSAPPSMSGPNPDAPAFQPTTPTPVVPVTRPSQVGLMASKFATPGSVPAPTTPIAAPPVAFGPPASRNISQGLQSSMFPSPAPPRGRSNSQRGRGRAGSRGRGNGRPTSSNPPRDAQGSLLPGTGIPEPRGGGNGHPRQYGTGRE